MEQNFPRERVSAMITGYVFSQAIFCVAKLELADKVASGPKSAAELARMSDCSPSHLERLMRALCSMGLFKEAPEGFTLTPMGNFLRRSVPDSLWPLASLHGSEMYQAFTGLLDNVKTGYSAWDLTLGESVWDYMRQYPERAAVFDGAMERNYRSEEIASMVKAYDFSRGVVADIGGGEGSLLRGILARNEDTRGVLFDTPDVIQRARVSPEWAPYAARSRFESGDFFAGVPAEADIYVLRHVLHDWSDGDCVRLLKHCAQAMKPSSRLLIFEMTLSPERPWSYWSDLGVMVIGGKERSSEDYGKLLSDAGLKLLRSAPASFRLGMIEAGIA